MKRAAPFLMINVERDISRKGTFYQSMSEILVISNDSIAHAVDVLKRGGVVAYPTDTVFGLGADALNSDAVERVFSAKGRKPDNPVPLLLDSPESLDSVGKEAGAMVRMLASRFWPGPLTIVLNASDLVCEVVTAGTGTIGVRVPDHPVPRALARHLGRPITGTSANRSGEQPSKRASDIADSLGDAVDLILGGECGDNVLASTVVDCVSDTARILREGAIASDRILGAIEELLTKQDSGRMGQDKR